MAYKVKYRLDYCNKEKLNARLDFEIKDYTSTIIHDIVGTQNAFSYKVRNEKPDRSGYFRTLEADINIFEDENFNIDNLLTSDETKIRVKFYIENQLEFVGFIIPDFFEVSIDKPRVISMVASDRIGTLKNQTLPRQTGVQSFRYMLEQSLLKTGLDLPLNSTINFNPIGQSGDFLTNTGGLMERLSSDKGASISCYDIIKSILIVSNAFLVQSKGQWHILNKLEYESRPKTKDIEQINVGGRRLINPPSSKVGVMAEFGGGMKNPINYNFKSLDGWTSYNGFNAELTNKEVAGYSGNNPVYGDSTINNSLIVSTPLNNNIYIESDAIKATVKGRRINFSVDVNFTTQAGKDVFYQVVARKGSDELYLNSNGSFVGYASFGINLVLLRVEAPDGDANSAVVASQSVDGTLVLEDDEVVSDWSFHIRHYRLSSNDPIHLVNHSSVTFITEGEQKGNLYKIEQGVNFTKESEIDTTVFGGYINKGVNGYFYNYQRDELNQIYYKIGSRWESFGLKWQTANNNTADYLLLHSVRQRAVMFSDAHNIITAIVKGKFSALDIYSVCGVKYVLVEAEYDFYRNETELRIEEIKYDNSVLKTDYIYSYFGGEDTTSISGVSSVGSSSGGGGSSFQSLIKIDDDGNYYVEENFYSLKDVSAFGKNDLGDGGNGDGVALTSWIDQITTLTDFNQNTKFIKQSEVVDNLTSNLSNLPLSARQGMILKNFIDNIEVGEGGQVVVDWDSILGKPSTFAPSAHAHVISDVTGLQNALDAKTSKTYVDDGLATKENAFAKNTAFNRNFGTTAGTVSQGNHTHTFASLTGKPTTLAGYGITDGAKSVDVNAHITDKENPHSVTKTQIGLSNVTNVLQATKTEFDTFKNFFDSLFELDGDYIKAKKSLYSTGDLSAFGKDNLGGGGTGGGTDLVSWVDQIMALTDFNVGSNFTTQSDIDSAIDGIEIGGRNLIVRSDLEVGKYINQTTGLIANTSMQTATGFIKAEPLSEYIYSGRLGVNQVRFVAYDSNKEFISGVLLSGYQGDYSIYKTPANTAFIRMSAAFETGTHYNEWKLEKGNKATDWTPAPEDQVSDWNSTNSNSFDFIKNKPTKLSQFSNVETDFVNKTYVDNTFTTISNFNTHTSNTTLHKTQSDREAIASFLSMFEMDGDFIKAKKSLYSTGDLSAFGKDNLGGGSSGGTDLVSWVDQITTLTDFNQSTNFINIQQVEAKGYATVTQLNDRVKTPVPLNAKFTDTIVDISGKVDKVAGKSLISDSEIARLSNVTNQDLTPYATNSRVNAIDTRLVTVESNYTTQSDIDNAIDDLEIGGRNLILRSTNLTNISSNDGSTISIISNENGEVSFTASAGDESSAMKAYWTASLSEEKVVGNTYTASVWVKNTRPDSIRILVGWNGFSEGKQVYEILPSDGWVLVKQTGKASASNTQLQFSSNTPISAVNASFKKPMLQEGNKETGWELAPEDQVSDWFSTNVNAFDFIKNKPTKLSQFSNVETDFVNKTYVDNTFATISNFNTHTSNTTLHKTQSDRDAIASFLSMFEMDGDFIRAKHSLYSVGDLSAFGKDNLGGGGAGGTDLVSWVDQITTLTDFNQSTNFINIQQVEAKGYATNTRVDGINSRLTSVEGGSVTTVTTSGSGNAITSISKSGTVITATKGDTFSKVGHSHAISDITNLQTELNSKASNTTVNGISSRLTTVESNYTTQSDIDSAINELEIGGRNLIIKGTVLDDTYVFQSTGELVPSSAHMATDYIPVTEGVEYIMSAPEIYQVRIVYYDASKIYISGALYVGSQGKEKLIHTPALTAFVRISADKSTGTPLSGNWKFEKGNKPTDWSPAPEDQISDWNQSNVNSFDFIKNKPTKLSQFSNVETDFTSKTYVTTELNKKVDKVSGKSLISDTEISRLSTVTNQTATSIGLGNVTNESKTTMFASPTFTGTVSGVTKSMVGLSNVDNVKQATKTEFDNFVALRNNPHEVTKAQVGLTNVTNVLQASKSEFDARVLVVDNHINDKTNPHAVTKKQVGLEFATNESKATMFTDPTFTGTTKVTILELNTNWKFVKVGNNIELQYNGVTKQEMTSDGHIIAHGDVTALLDN